jgi:excisionase family DNA binding protein
VSVPSSATRLLAVLSPELVQAIEELVDERVCERLDRVAGASDSASPWLSVVEAAVLLRCKRQRVDDLLSQGRLARYKDGSRTLVSRIELDEYLRKQRG